LHQDFNYRNPEKAWGLDTCISMKLRIGNERIGSYLQRRWRGGETKQKSAGAKIFKIVKIKSF
jgi:hypothetical protein